MISSYVGVVYYLGFHSMLIHDYYVVTWPQTDWTSFSIVFWYSQCLLHCLALIFQCWKCYNFSAATEWTETTCHMTWLSSLLVAPVWTVIHCFIAWWISIINPKTVHSSLSIYISAILVHLQDFVVRGSYCQCTLLRAPLLFSSISLVLQNQSQVADFHFTMLLVPCWYFC